ncbi:S1-like domain-containing RNA-binding protein [soil metagenome]
MLRIGDYNRLQVVKEVDFGMYLKSDQGEILLPKKYIEPGTEVDQFVNVFVYTDSEDRLIATNLKPKAVVDEFAAMKVKHTTDFGAFLDWGLEKDLLVPFREQHRRLKVGDTAVVRVSLDHKTNRVIGVGKLAPFINKDVSGLEEGQKVDLLIYDFTDLGILALINEEYSGMLYANEVFEELEIGDRKEGYIKKIREDGKIDLALQKQGYGAVKDSTEGILESLKKSGGYLPYHDKSDPDEIQKVFKMSKKTFKKAIGSLYKEGNIRIDDKGISLINSD